MKVKVWRLVDVDPERLCYLGYLYNNEAPAYNQSNYFNIQSEIEYKRK